MTLILGKSDVQDLVTLEDAIELTEQLFIEDRAEQTVIHSPIRIRGKESRLRVVSGTLLDHQVMGARLSSSGGGSVAVLCDTGTGETLAVISYPFSVLRTGATVAAGTKWLAKNDAKRVALIGTGNNALSLLEGIMAVREIEEIRVYSRQPENRTAFSNAASERLGLRVYPVGSTDEAIEGTDIVTVSTNAQDPTFDYTRLRPGMHVNSMGLPGELATELYGAPYEVFASSPQQERHYASYQRYLERQFKHHPIDLSDEAAWSRIHSVADVMDGSTVRGNETITVFRESQGGTGDLIFALRAYERARELGRGISVDDW